jgi:hypothetical protein
MNSYDIHSSTELMQNYLPSETMAPEKQIRAVESSTGTAILFSIDTEDFLRVTAEAPGDRHGWQRFNVSSKTHPEGFAEGDAACIIFEVARCAEGSLRVAMVLKDKKNDKANDVLYLASISPGTETAWFNSPTWVRYEYDHTDNKRSPVKIVNVFLSEATDGFYTVVDVRAATDPSNIFRYYIDVDHKSGEPAWKPHDLDIEIQADKYSSSLGRKAGKDVDGIYTSGHEGNHAQILYTPLHGTKGRKPSSVFLQMPKNLKPDATATCRYQDNTSALFVAAAGGLYYFASDNQREDATAVEIMSGDKRLNRVNSLFAAVDAETVIVWGHNEDMEFFYTSCPVSQITAKPSAWSIPLPIMSGVQQVAPFLNRTHSANTFFAHTTGSHLKIAVKAPGKNKPWNVRDVNLPPSRPKHPAKSFNSYTTHLKVIGANKRPKSDKKVSIKAANVTSVHINHLYYVVGPQQPILVDPDPTGSVTIVETTSRLDATHFSVSVVGDDKTPTEIDPMQEAPHVNKQLQKLNSVSGLMDATIFCYKNGKKVPSKKLVRDSKRNIHDPDLKAAVANIDYLWKAHAQLANPKPGPLFRSSPERIDEYKNFVGDKKVVLVDAGDLLSMLESSKTHAVAALAGGVRVGAEESWWEVFVHWIEDAWHFIVKIGEAIFAFVIEVIEDVYAAFKYVFNKIVETIEDIIDFVEYLFEIEDIQRTKNVFQHVTTLYLRDQLQIIPKLSKDFDAWIDPIVKEINQWANLSDAQFDALKLLPTKLDEMPSEMQPPSATGSFFTYHFVNNVPAVSQLSEIAPLDGESPLLAKLQSIIKEEFETLSTAAQELFNLVTNVGEKQAVDVVKGLIGILAKVVLKSFKALIHALLALFDALAQTAMQAFTGPLYIPVISEILALFGISDFSALDVISWLAAFPVTIAYKALKSEAPFPDTAQTTFLSSGAPDFESVINKLNGTPRPIAAAVGGTAASTSFVGAGESWDKEQRVFFSCLHAGSGCLAGVAAVTGIIEAEILSKEPESPLLSGPRMVIGGVSVMDAMLRFSANMGLPHAPIKDPLSWKAGAARVANGLTIFNKLIFSASPMLGMPVYSKIGAVSDFAFIIWQVVMTGIHFEELSKAPHGHDEKMAFIDEGSSISVYLARACRHLLVLDVGKLLGPYGEAGLAGGVVAMRIFQAALQFTEVGLEWTDPHQNQ